MQKKVRRKIKVRKKNKSKKKNKNGECHFYFLFLFRYINIMEESNKNVDQNIEQNVKDNFHIILVGEGCQVSWDLEKLKLKGPTSLFEWFLSVKFSDINNIVKKITNDEEILITDGMYGNIFLDTTEIRSSHYTKENFKEILLRRKNRFVEQIKSGKKILFIRKEHAYYDTTESDMIEFKNLIEKINPRCDYKFLLMMPLGKTRDPLNIERLYHKIDENSLDIFRKYIYELTMN